MNNRVTIHVCTRDRWSELGLLLQSLRTQTYKEWDIFIPSKNMGVEIKSDKMSQSTGNIVVEINFNNKPSALSTTKSKYWIFDTGLKSITVEVNDLKNLVKQFKTRHFTARGDTKQKEAYLIKQKFIEDISTNID